MPVKLIDADDTFQVTDAELMPGEGDAETVYTVRPISVDDHRRLQKACTKDVINRRTHQKEPQVDHEALGDAILDFVLVGWVGMLLKGETAECSTANKFKLDGKRRIALSDRAGMNQIARAPEVRAESFREPT